MEYSPVGAQVKKDRMPSALSPEPQLPHSDQLQIEAYAGTQVNRFSEMPPKVQDNLEAIDQVNLRESDSNTIKKESNSLSAEVFCLKDN